MSIGLHFDINETHNAADIERTNLPDLSFDTNRKENKSYMVWKLFVGFAKKLFQDFGMENSHMMLLFVECIFVGRKYY